MAAGGTGSSEGATCRCGPGPQPWRAESGRDAGAPAPPALLRDMGSTCPVSCPLVQLGSPVASSRVLESRILPKDDFSKSHHPLFRSRRRVLYVQPSLLLGGSCG